MQAAREKLIWPLGPLRFDFPFRRLPCEESSVAEFTLGNFF